MSDTAANASDAVALSWLTVVGIGEDGWDGLNAEARRALEKAELIVGGARHLGLLPRGICLAANCREWGSPLRPFLYDLVAELVAREDPPATCLLASGDPLLYGVGSLLVQKFPQLPIRFLPHLSSYALICARMGWSQTRTQLVTACGRPIAVLNAALFPEAQIVLFSAGPQTPHEAAALLKQRGFGQSEIHVFEHVGGPKESHRVFLASDLPKEAKFASLNAMAISCVAGPFAQIWSPVPGLPEAAYETDGQITKREIRALVLAHLSPRPGELLWDIGAGSGSIAIEWMRGVRNARAIAVEPLPERVEKIHKNAFSLGVPGLEIVMGRAPEALEGLPRPHAIFIGGGLTTPGVLERSWQALLPGGRLVANAVTLETEAVLHEARGRYGGELTRLAISRPGALGSFTCWRPALPVVQWATEKPRKGAEP